MACDLGTTYIDYWTDYQWFDAVFCYYADQLGVSVVSFLFFGVTFMSLYVGTGSIYVPTVLGIIVAGIAFALLPATGIEVGLLILVLGSAAVMYLFARRTAVD